MCGLGLETYEPPTPTLLPLYLPLSLKFHVIQWLRCIVHSYILPHYDEIVYGGVKYMGGILHFGDSIWTITYVDKCW